MIDKKYSPLLFGLILSGLMSMLVSGLSTWRVAGLSSHFPVQWASAWLFAWMVAFPAVLVMAPLARKLVERLTAAR